MVAFVSQISCLLRDKVGLDVRPAFTIGGYLPPTRRTRRVADAQDTRPALASGALRGAPETSYGVRCFAASVARAAAVNGYGMRVYMYRRARSPECAISPAAKRSAPPPTH